jgi:BirA family biotin operon repressor/biotin-[acetyl-CoA-carboxylase] ligase
MTPDEPTSRKILHALKDHQGEFLSGNLLASLLGLTRTAIWKHVKALKSIGYDIESHPRQGYRLASIPDLLIPEEVVPYLSTRWLGHTYHHHRQIGSTNDEAFVLAIRDAPHGTVVVAEEQTSGRGRMRRPWVSSSMRGIYMSILLRAPLPIRDAPQSTLVAALALAKVLKTRHNLSAAIKWPNDVLIGGKKVCGILTEMQSDQELTRFIIIGIGINVNQDMEQLEGPFRYPAASVAVELGATIRRQELLVHYLHQFETDFDRFQTTGFSSLLEELEAASATIGRTISVQCGDAQCVGKALGFTPQGALRLLGEDGREQIIWAGDVSLVKGGR